MEDLKKEEEVICPYCQRKFSISTPEEAEDNIDEINAQIEIDSKNEEGEDGAGFDIDEEEEDEDEDNEEEDAS
jgi:uncharacterized Zn finger protein (UPF0148 family)